MDRRTQRGPAFADAPTSIFYAVAAGSVMRVLWVALLVALSGCTDGGEEAAGTPDDVAPEPESGAAPLEAPTLPVGRSWTYRTGGVWDAPDQVTVVVARADEAGYLLAGATEDDLLDEVFWDRLYLGPTDRDLRPLDGAGAPLPSRLVAFPLQDGTSWSLYGIEVVAEAGPVTVLGTEVPGFRIRGADGDRRVEVDYAPSVGAVSRFALFTGGDEPAEALELTAVGESPSWVWMERVSEVVASAAVEPGRGTAAPPAVLEVGADVDAVMLWGLATEGSRGSVVPPDGSAPWTFEGQGVEEFQYAVLPAAEGTWHGTGVPGGADGWVYVQMHAVRWLPGP